MRHRIARTAVVALLAFVASGAAVAGATSSGPTIVIGRPKNPAVTPAQNSQQYRAIPFPSGIRKTHASGSTSRLIPPKPVVGVRSNPGVHTLAPRSVGVAHGAKTRQYHVVIRSASGSVSHPVSNTGASSSSDRRPVLPDVPWQWLVPGLLLGFAGIVMASLRRPKRPVAA
jgi:hypothetical protein